MKKIILNPFLIRQYIIIKKTCKGFLNNITEENREIVNSWFKRIARINKHNRIRNQAYRSFICSTIKSLREVYPYIPDDYHAKKEKYNEALALVNKMKVGDWITVTTNEWIEHQDYYRYNEYNICSIVDEIKPYSGKIIKINYKYKYVEIETGINLTNDVYFGQFRFATDSEILQSIDNFKEIELNKINEEIADYIKILDILITAKENLKNYE